jgi:phage terminase Nu1 subunit (DNA packaging protein)
MTAEPSNEKATPFPKIIWGAGQLAALLGMTPRNLQLLAEKGIAVKDGRGKYDVCATVQNLLNDLRMGSTEEGIDAKAQWEIERARLTAARADKAELELAILRGDAVLMPDVEALVAEEYGALRLGLSQVPNSMARKVANESDPAVCQAIITDGIEASLRILTADQPGGRRPRTRQLPGADTVDDDDADN